MRFPSGIFARESRMSADKIPHPPQDGSAKRFFAKKFSLSDRAAAGFGGIIAFLFCAVIIAGLGAHAARVAADDMRSRYLPFLETAHSLEGVVYEAAFHVGMFGISGDMASYSGARIRFSNIRSTVKLLAAQAPGIPEGDTLTRDMEVLDGFAARLDMVVEKKRTLNDELADKQADLRKVADDMGEILLDLQARVASAREGRGNDISLDEKARMLVLNGFSLTVAELAGRVLAAGAVKSAEDLAKAQAYFTVRWEEAREACFAAAALSSPEGISIAPHSAEDPASNLDTLVATYDELLGTIRYNLEETARVTEDRVQITGSLTALTRRLVAIASSSIDAAANKTDTLLRGTVAILFACAFLACILAVGAALVFVARVRQAGATVADRSRK